MQIPVWTRVELGILNTRARGNCRGPCHCGLEDTEAKCNPGTCRSQLAQDWLPCPRSAGCPANLTVSLWFTGWLPHCVEMKHLGGIGEIIFGIFLLGCTLLISGLKAWGGCKEHFQRAGRGGGLWKNWGRRGERRKEKGFVMRATLIQRGEFLWSIVNCEYLFQLAAGEFTGRAASPGRWFNLSLLLSPAGTQRKESVGMGGWGCRQLWSLPGFRLCCWANCHLSQTPV